MGILGRGRPRWRAGRSFVIVLATMNGAPVLTLWPLALISLLICACPGAAEPPGGGHNSGGERPPAPVSVETAGEPRLDRSFSVLGEVRTRHHAELAVGVDGAVVKLDALEGQRIARGALLVLVDDAVARADLQVAEAALDEAGAELRRAEADLRRYEQVDSQVLAGAEMDRVQADAARLQARGRTLEARVALAKAKVARHAVRAPFGGVVTRRHADPGDWVTPGRVLLELASTEDLDVLVDVDPVLAERIEAGQAVTIRATRGEVAGEIAAVVPVLDPNTRTARVRIAPALEPKVLTPGASVTVVFDTALSLPHGARVPRDAVSSSMGNAQVVKVVDGAAQPTPVTVLAEAPTALLVDGVEPGDVLVTRGNERLRPGQALRVLGEEP